MDRCRLIRHEFLSVVTYFGSSETNSDNLSGEKQVGETGVSPVGLFF